MHTDLSPCETSESANEQHIDLLSLHPFRMNRSRIKSHTTDEATSNWQHAKSATMCHCTSRTPSKQWGSLPITETNLPHESHRRNQNKTTRPWGRNESILYRTAQTTRSPIQQRRDLNLTTIPTKRNTTKRDCKNQQLPTPTQPDVVQPCFERRDQQGR